MCWPDFWIRKGSGFSPAFSRFSFSARNRGLGGLEGTVQPAQHREGKDDAAVLGLLVIASQQVGDRQEQGGEVAVAHVSFRCVEEIDRARRIEQLCLVRLDDYAIRGGVHGVERGGCTTRLRSRARTMQPEQAQSTRSASATSIPSYHETIRRATGGRCRLFHDALIGERDFPACAASHR